MMIATQTVKRISRNTVPLRSKSTAQLLETRLTWEDRVQRARVSQSRDRDTETVVFFISKFRSIALHCATSPENKQTPKKKQP